MFLYGISLLLAFFLFTSTTLFAEEPAFLPKDAKLAIIGDSITEQKLYSKYVEAYILACAGRGDVKVFQFGWSGETAQGFAARLENDLSVFNPTVATICYGMNDGGYKPYSDEIGNRYETNLRLVIEGLGKVGVKNVLVGSPGAVDSKFFIRATATPSIYNENLGRLRDIAKQVAGDYKQPFTDVHSTMVEAMAKAKAALGDDYAVCGQDGVHPASNGHLLMAKAFLKGLGFKGDLGKITIDMTGSATATGYHKVLASTGGTCEIESISWPFCFDSDLKSISSTRSILAFSSFNQDLNRLTLVVKGLTKEKAKVAWGAASKEFTKNQLEQGINLADEFAAATPFDASFSQLLAGLGRKQTLETTIIKSFITNLPKFATLTTYDPELAKDLQGIRAKFIAKQAELDAETRDFVKPLRHTLTVTEE